MSELDLFDSHVNFESLGQHAKRSITDLVVAHVEDLEVSLLEQALLEGLYLRI